MYKIWLVEDELAIAEVVAAYLKKANYEVTCFDDGLKAMQALANQSPDLMILDINLPVYTGIDILSSYRQRSDNPVIFLTSSTDEVSRILGFELGADDYVTKPFSAAELVHRVKRIIKRVYGERQRLVVDADKWVDLATYDLYSDGQKIDLTVNEVRILATLIKEKPRVLSRQQMIDLTFGRDYEATDRNIDTYVKSIRQKLEKDPKNPRLIKTKYGIGYYFGG